MGAGVDDCTTTEYIIPMSEESLREPQMGLTFEKVWAMFQETRLQMQETDRKISSLGSKLGDLIEELIFPNLPEKFNKLGYVFGKAATNIRYRDSRGLVIAEVDILLENGEYALAVEVKTTLRVGDVRNHLKRMETLRRYADEHQDKRKLLGAVAGAITTKEATDLAIRNDFFVLEQSGETIRINVPEGFKPKEW